MRWPRGLLVGVAAAMKLTPAAFQTGRPGSLVNAANQSVQAVLARAGLDPHTPTGTAAWLALSAVVVALAWYGMRNAVARSADAWALSLNAFAALLISPISWSHHWVWAGPALLVLAIGGLRDRRRGVLAGAAAGLAVFIAAPQWWFPADSDRWAAWQQAVGSSYVILAAVILLLSAGRHKPLSGDPHTTVRSSKSSDYPERTVVSRAIAATCPRPSGRRNVVPTGGNLT